MADREAPSVSEAANSAVPSPEQREGAAGAQIKGNALRAKGQGARSKKQEASREAATFLGRWCKPAETKKGMKPDGSIPF